MRKSVAIYESPAGRMLLVASEKGLRELNFMKADAWEEISNELGGEEGAGHLDCAKKWLDIYFSGREPGFMPIICLNGTDFQMRVWKLLLEIPWGKTTTYGEIASCFMKQSGECGILARAVGGAVGRNRIAIMVPCHRVTGAHGNLGGYSGGIEKKCLLLKNEGVDLADFRMPKPLLCQNVTNNSSMAMTHI